MLGSDTEERRVQELNALLPMEVTPSGIVMEASLVHWLNVISAMAVMEVGILRETSELQF